MSDEYFKSIQLFIIKAIESEYKGKPPSDRDCLYNIARLKGISYTALGSNYGNQTLH